MVIFSPLRITMAESTDVSQPSPSSNDSVQLNKDSPEEHRDGSVSKPCSPGEERPPLTALMSADSSGSSQDGGARCKKAVVDLPLSQEELRVLVDLTSLDFGFVVVQEAEESARDVGTPRTVQRSLLLKVVASWTRLVSDDPTLDCNLGHVFLLLEEFEKAKLHYERYGGRYGSSASDVSYLYGMGLVYFHFDHLHGEKAAECFHRVLSLSPSFPRGNEALLRLAILAHKQGDYEQALKDFNLVYHDERECSLTAPEVLVYIGHLQALLKHPVEAVEVFNRILATPNITQKLASLAYRKLGWLYHTCPSLDAICPSRATKSLEMLNSAVGASPSCWQSWFLLGRCHAAHGRVQEAFMALRQAISKNSTRPEVWCAIGMLYHQQAQATDALQAYLSAIYIDPAHTLSWCNLAILYQSLDQAIDALVCYENAQRNASKTDHLLAIVHSKIGAIRSTVSSNYHQLCAQAHYIPGLVEAWPRLVAPLVRQQQKEPQLPIMSPTSLSVAHSPAPPQSPAFGATFGSLPGRERDKHKSQEPIIITGFSQTSLSSPTYPPNQVAPSAVWPRPPAPPFVHSDYTQWSGTYSYHSNGTQLHQGIPPARPNFPCPSADLPHNPSVDVTPVLQPHTPLPHLSRDDVLDVFARLSTSSTSQPTSTITEVLGIPLDPTEVPFNSHWSQQDSLMFGDLPLSHSSTSLPAALHLEAGVEDSRHGYSRSLQPSPVPTNPSVCASRKREGGASSVTDHKRFCRGIDSCVTSSGPVPTQTVGFPSHLGGMCSVEGASHYTASAQGISLVTDPPNHRVGYVPPCQDMVGCLPPAQNPSPHSHHQPSGLVFNQEVTGLLPEGIQHDTKTKFSLLPSWCDLASDHRMTNSPPHLAANQTPLLQIGLDQQCYM